ncbi:hypothetical protein HPP92_020741 [Vanilla planifolia]|uniref:DYW domain-containing protein n=1 Tax=Vanilla planifolia TaxID=51239 RepID=A0A835PVD4_VANPL|nr:hypothetical protein HPP92_020741 [Vanilla planifolia]
MEREPRPPFELSCVHYRYLLRSCAKGNAPTVLGLSLHAFFIKTCFPFSVISSNVYTALFHMYAALGPPSSALHAFREIPSYARSRVDWTALISCHVRHALPSRALALFRTMFRGGFIPDEITLLPVFSSAACLLYPSIGALAHALIHKLGLNICASVSNAAMNMYAKCGQMLDARRIFDEMACPNVISWTVILVGALRWEGILGGRRVFDQMPERSEVSWTVMVGAYVEVGLPREALALLKNMLLCPDSIIRNLSHVSLCSLLSACSQAGDLTMGRLLHTFTLKTNLVNERHILLVNTALIDMYAKGGGICAARTVFDVMRDRGVVTWNAMLSGLSMHGMCAEAVRLFSRMVKDEALQPDDITFVSVLSACSRSGMVDRGRAFFLEMNQIYGLTPRVEHYACMVDLLGRSGHLEEAEALIREMPFSPNEVVLGSLIASCSLHGKLQLSRKLLQELLHVNPSNVEYHVLLSNLYSFHGRRCEAVELRRQLKNGEEKGRPGMSYIEINGQVHRFSAGDKSHPRTQELYTKLDEIARRLRSVGYVPNVTSQLPHSMDDGLMTEEEKEEREQALLSHSEKLAIAFGLISTKNGSPLRIFKNLRICFDCHSAIKLISEIFSREIIVRDRNRFHRFKDGLLPRGLLDMDGSAPILEDISPVCKWFFLRDLVLDAM